MTAKSEATASARVGEYLVPLEAKVSRCRTCGTSVCWVKMASGRLAPLDLTTVECRDGRRYALTHFATCPQSCEWRHGVAPAAELTPGPSSEARGWDVRRERHRLPDGSLVCCWWRYGRRDQRQPALAAGHDLSTDLARRAEEDEVPR